MPGLVDCHFHPAQYSNAGIVPGTFADLLTTYIPAELAFRNTTFAREQSMTLVVSKLYTVTVIFVHLGTTLQKQVGYFDHRVVTLVTVKLERQWL